MLEVRKEVEADGFVDSYRLERLSVSKYTDSVAGSRFSVNFGYGDFWPEQDGKTELVFFSRHHFEEIGLFVRRALEEKEGFTVIGGLTVDYLYPVFADGVRMKHLWRFAWNSESGLGEEHDSVFSAGADLFYAVQDLLHG
jgi:hypothetical protein